MGFLYKFSLRRALFEARSSIHFYSLYRKKKKKKRYKAIHWQIVTRKVTENGLGAINTGRGSERGWCSGVELRTRASCVTDVQQVAFLGSYPLAPSLPSPSLQANPGHIKSFLNVLTLAVWLLFDRYRPHFDVHPSPIFIPRCSPLFQPELWILDPRGSIVSMRNIFLYTEFLFHFSSVIHFFPPLLFVSLLIQFVSYCSIFFRCFFFVCWARSKLKVFFKWKVVKSIKISWSKMRELKFYWKNIFLKILK